MNLTHTDSQKTPAHTRTQTHRPFDKQCKEAVSPSMTPTLCLHVQYVHLYIGVYTGVCVCARVSVSACLSKSALSWVDKISVFMPKPCDITQLDRHLNHLPETSSLGPLQIYVPWRVCVVKIIDVRQLILRSYIILQIWVWILNCQGKKVNKVLTAGRTFLKLTFKWGIYAAYC